MPRGAAYLGRCGAWGGALLAALVLAGCEEPTPPPEPLPEEPLDDPAAAPPPPEVVYAPEETAAAIARARSPRTVATVGDERFAEGPPVPARRVVYRVTLLVTPGLGSTGSALREATAELSIDVSMDRLRARFVGAGWPLPEGTEVRIRRDLPGVYLFDGQGGRPLGPGQMAAWFRDGRVRKAARLWIRQPISRTEGPGDLICRFIAEWAAASVDDLARRCGSGGAPPAFRVGPWRAEQTADVEVTLPRSALRADAESPPSVPPDEESGIFLPPHVLRHLRPRWHAAPLVDGGPPPEATLRVANQGRRRMIVILNGTALGWVGKGATLEVGGLWPGTYQLGAMGPFGPQTANLRPVRLPGELVVLPR